jgi:uncharacterized membrane protein YjjP (DUF1212 family)
MPELSDIAPATVLLLLLATMSAALAHALWGRHWLQLPLFWFAALVGCLLAYGLGLRLPLPITLVQPAGVPVLEAILLAWLLLGVASRLRV